MPIPDSLRTKIKQLLGNHKKLCAEAKENGEVSEEAAASMSKGVYELLAGDAVAAGSAFRWSWLTCQWNLGCRSVNVEKILLDHMGVEGDAITISFARTKSDLGGDVRHLKHVCANPLDPKTCAVLSPGVQLMATAASRNENGTSPASRLCQGKTQAHRFNEQLGKAAGDREDELQGLGFVEKGDHMSTHSIRKGVGTHMTAAPGGPGIITICLRLSWALGQVMSACLKLEAGGDQFAGRAAACLPLDSSNFAVLPPHFPDPSDVDVVAAAEESFGEIWSDHRDLHGLLVRLLASVVCHRDCLVKEFGAGNSALLQGLPVFQDEARLVRLQRAVTTKGGVLTATGVPPTVLLFRKVDMLADQLNALASKIDEMPAQIVKEFLGLRDSQIEHAGFVTQAMLESALQAQATLISQTLKQHMDALGNGSMHADPPAPNGPADGNGAAAWGKHPSKLMQRHGGRLGRPSPLCDTPPGFTMPKGPGTLHSVARLWWLGNKGHPDAGAGCKIRPCRNLTSASFGPSVAHLKKRLVNFKEVYPKEHDLWTENKRTLTKLTALMAVFEEAVLATNLAATEAAEEAGDEPGLFDLEGDMSEQTFTAVFKLGVTHLQTNVIPHVYENSKSQQRWGQNQWTSFRQWVKPAVIMKAGNDPACKYLALRIVSATGFERTAGYLKRKHEITPAQLAELEAGVPCKRRRTGGGDAT